jgi:predicted amidophosphoribosyltransferase
VPILLPDRLTWIDETNRDQHAFLQEGDRCLFFGEYFAGKGYQGGGTNQLMFNFKTLPSIARTNPARRNYKESAIATVATGLREVVGRNQIERLTFVPIPPSKTSDHPDYDDRLTRALTMGCADINSDIRLLLRRLSSTESDHSTGARLTPEALHSLLELDSSAVAAMPLREAIVLFDDVITTGKSFKCCERRLREAIPATVPIIGLFVARRILRNPFDDLENVD